MLELLVKSLSDTSRKWEITHRKTLCIYVLFESNLISLIFFLVSEIRF